MRVINFVKSFFGNIQFTYNNWFKTQSVKNIKAISLGGISFRGMLPIDERQVVEIYFQLNNGTKFSWSKRWLYRLAGSKLMLVAVKQDAVGEKIVGMNMYYLNKRDMVEGTIHEGFIGVLPKMNGLGIATNLRQLAKHHFFSNRYSGISTRISLNNFPSMKSALNIGFKPVEKYFDSELNEERYYMICDLERNQ